MSPVKAIVIIANTIYKNKIYKNLNSNTSNFIYTIF